MTICELCGEPMPPGEEMFKYHGYSGPCPKPPLVANNPPVSKSVEKRLKVQSSERTWTPPIVHWATQSEVGSCNFHALPFGNGDDDVLVVKKASGGKTVRICEQCLAVIVEASKRAASGR